MIRGNDFSPDIYEVEHVDKVMAQIERQFPVYWESFAREPIEELFAKAIESWQKERDKYSEYMSPEALEEFDYDPNAFKSYTRKGGCPIIHRCLMSPDEVMKPYRRAFNDTSGRQLLDTVRAISHFGLSYFAQFHGADHEVSQFFGDLGLDTLNTDEYQCTGVIGYGVQSSLLYGLYASQFAHRSQNAVWALYFLSGRKDFGLSDGSEFLMIQPDKGICEQNFFYPAELFGFYSLKVMLMLKAACRDAGVILRDHYRYVYLSCFCDHVAESHRDDINTYRRSSEYVESQPWF